tara:strand:+ start:7121 stop:7315 length:195 start_codon:yes stop_codon:yes gene_type:complete
MRNLREEIVKNSINESLMNILDSFELTTNKKVDRDSQDWGDLEKIILVCLTKNSNNSSTSSLSF